MSKVICLLALIIPLSALGCFAENRSNAGFEETVVFPDAGSSARPAPKEAADPRISWALDPPTPKLFMPTTKSRSLGHGIGSVGTLSLHD